MGVFSTYFNATRPGFFTGVIMPVSLGAFYARHNGFAFDTFAFILSLVAAICYHGGVNTLNDYFDHKNGTDEINVNRIFPFTGGSRVIQNNILTPGNVLMLSISLFAAGSIIGLYLAYVKGPLLLAIGAIGLFSCIFYNAPPLFLAGRGIGELLVGLNFGVLTVLGSYYVQAQSISIDAAIVSLPLGFLITALLYINQFPDYEADKASGKANLVVRLGPRKSRWLFIPIVVGTYLSLIAAVLLGFLPNIALITLITAIPALYATDGLMRNFMNVRELTPSIKSIIAAHALTGVLMTVSTFF